MDKFKPATSDKKGCAVALFFLDFRSLTGLLIAAATRSLFVHAAVRVNGTWYHSSESINRFDLVDMESHGPRRALVWELDDSGSKALDWLRGMKGTRYDWVGIGGWVVYTLSRILTRGRYKLYFEKDTHFFCFETGVSFICQLTGKPKPPQPYSGNTIQDMFDAPAKSGVFSDIC